MSVWRYRGPDCVPLSVGIGALSGFCSGLAQTGGPPIVGYWLGRPLASHIALEEVGAAYEARPVDLSAQQQAGPEFLKLNPKGRVPALVTDRGVVTENVAILAYIAQSFPAAALAPLGDPFQFARMQAFNAYLSSTVHVAHAHGRRGYRWSDDAAAIERMKAKFPRTMGDSFDIIEHHLFEGPWVLGEAYSVADPYLFTIGLWLESDRVDPARFPGVLAHRARMMERPAVRTVLAVVNG